MDSDFPPAAFVLPSSFPSAELLLSLLTNGSGFAYPAPTSLKISHMWYSLSYHKRNDLPKFCHEKWRPGLTGPLLIEYFRGYSLALPHPTYIPVSTMATKQLHSIYRIDSEGVAPPTPHHCLQSRKMYDPKTGGSQSCWVSALNVLLY